MKPECRRTQSHLSAYLDGEIEPGEHQAVLRHLEACGDCRLELEQYREVDRVLTATRAHLPDAGDLKSAFYARLAAEERRSRREWGWRKLTPAFATFALGLLFCTGYFGIGYFRTGYQDQSANRAEMPANFSATGRTGLSKPLLATPEPLSQVQSVLPEQAAGSISLSAKNVRPLELSNLGSVREQQSLPNPKLKSRSVREQISVGSARRQIASKKGYGISVESDGSRFTTRKRAMATTIASANLRTRAFVIGEMNNDLDKNLLGDMRGRHAKRDTDQTNADRYVASLNRETTNGSDTDGHSSARLGGAQSDSEECGIDLTIRDTERGFIRSIRDVSFVEQTGSVRKVHVESGDWENSVSNGSAHSSSQSSVNDFPQGSSSADKQSDTKQSDGEQKVER